MVDSRGKKLIERSVASLRSRCDVDDTLRRSAKTTLIRCRWKKELKTDEKIDASLVTHRGHCLSETTTNHLGGLRKPGVLLHEDQQLPQLPLGDQKVYLRLSRMCARE
jgi:hypothetical protein